VDHTVKQDTTWFREASVQTVIRVFDVTRFRQQIATISTHCNVTCVLNVRYFWLLNDTARVRKMTPLKEGRPDSCVTAAAASLHVSMDPTQNVPYRPRRGRHRQSFQKSCVRAGSSAAMVSFTCDTCGDVMTKVRLALGASLAPH
jgi:hypothetical protein